MIVPLRVNLIALDSKLLPILSMRFLSPLTISSVWFSAMKISCLPFANGANSVSNVSAMEYSLNGLTIGVSFPLSNLKYSSKLFIIPAIRPVATLMVCAWRMRLSSSVSFNSSSALPLMTANGERRSCVTLCIKLRRIRISSSFWVLLAFSLQMISSRFLFSFALRRSSLCMARYDRNSRMMDREMAAVNRRMELSCDSVIFRSLAAKAVCACSLRSFIRQFSCMFSVRLRVRRLSA